MLFINCKAQEKAPVNFGKVSINDFTVNSTLINENTSAIIIADVGNVKFEGNAKGWFSYVFKRQKRIKIINKKAFNLAEERVHLYKKNELVEKLDKVSAIAYNVENGRVVKTELNDKDVYEDKVDKNHLYKKFAAPGVKEGSIVEIIYTIKSDFEFNLPAWEFQSVNVPTLWSEYNVTIPSLLNYIVINQGFHNYFIDSGSEGFESYSIRRNRDVAYVKTEESLTVSSPTVIHKWVIKDLEPFSIEDYVYSPKNFIDKISFQLSRTYDGESYHNVLNSWDEVGEELMKRDDFGGTLNEESNWKDELTEKIIDKGDSPLEIAKKIFYYIQKNYSCTNEYNKYITTTLKDVVNKKSGSVGDINLLLITLLKSKNIEAYPVLLSTRNYGTNISSYPVLEQINYVICKTVIDGKDYFLDATQSNLPFGTLPLDCFNGHARAISNTDTTAIYFKPDSIKESNLTYVNIFSDAPKKVAGTFKKQIGFYESVNIKNEIAITSSASFLNKIKNAYPDEYAVTNLKVDSLFFIQDPVTISFDFKLTGFNDLDMVYLNPILDNEHKTNPFTATERIYPVELPYKINDVYVFNMEIPEGYKVEDYPKSTRVKLNGEEGSFEYIMSVDKNLLQMRYSLVINKTNFSSNDYDTLREFYVFVAKKLSEQIVFKKIK